MNIWNFIKLFNRKNSWNLFLLCLKNPLFIIPTLIATRTCVKLCNEYYGTLHHKNNRTNAFRHALWNLLIIVRCKVFSRSNERLIQWATDITNWHEIFSPNTALAKAMDLHNNAIGRQIFKEHIDFQEAEFISLLKDKMKSAVMIKFVADIHSVGNELVYIEKLPKATDVKTRTY
ncbi:hypothetical protein MWU59_03885 [Flavobacteriaceae bacterium F08102]|nr:hypothetical protein [Flavobacteriaceae bacterium F08102]